jgi:hypothetical protein
MAKRVLISDLFLWAQKVAAVLPPSSRPLASSQRLPLLEVLYCWEQGVRDGDEGHLVRAAYWLLDQGVPADPTSMAAIRFDRSAKAARELMSAEGLSYWEIRLADAATTKQLRTVPERPGRNAADKVEEPAGC